MPLQRRHWSETSSWCQQHQCSWSWWNWLDSGKIKSKQPMQEIRESTRGLSNWWRNGWWTRCRPIEEVSRGFATQFQYWSLKHLCILFRIYPRNIELQYCHAVALINFFLCLRLLFPFFQPRNRPHPSCRRATQLWVRVYMSESLLLMSVSPPPQSEQPVCCILGCKKCAEKWETVLCLVLDEGATSHHFPSKHMLICTHFSVAFPPRSSFWTHCREWYFRCLIKLSSGIIFSLFLLWYFGRLLWVVDFVPP